MTDCNFIELHAFHLELVFMQLFSPFAGMVMRCHLSILHHNNLQDARIQQKDSRGNLVFVYPYVRASKEFKAKPKMLPPEHGWRADILDRCFFERKRVFDGGDRRPKVYTHIPSSSAPVQRPPVSELTKRYTQLFNFDAKRDGQSDTDSDSDESIEF